MELSGTLKDKMISFYQEQVVSYDSTGIEFENFYMNYNGEVTPTPWEENTFLKLNKNQERHIFNGLDRLHNLIYTKGVWAYDFKYLINRILNTPRNMTFLLFEVLYKEIMMAKDKSEVNLVKTSFMELLDYLQDMKINQIDLESLMRLHKMKKSYYPEDIQQEKIDTFKINEDEISQDKKDLVILGEFIAPKRVPIIASTLLQDDEFSRYILPIYFTIKNEKKAREWLALNKRHDLCYDIIEDNARKLSIPSNLSNMARR